MKPFHISTDAAFEVGVREGRKQMANHIEEILEVTSDPEVIKKYIKTIIKQDESHSQIKGFFKGIRQDEN